MKITIIIPVINEEKTIGTCLRQFSGAQHPYEIIVIDGGSTDRTLEIAGSFPEIKLLGSPHPGRGPQMNYGAENAGGNWLLFLHADTLLPNNWAEEVARAEASGYQAGCFRIDHTDDQKIPWLASTVNFRSHFSRFPYGDQGIFIRKNIFKKLSGYASIPIMEDYDLSIRFYRTYGRFYHSRKNVKPSYRRFRKQPIKSALIMFWFPKLFRWGVSPHRLAKFYETIR